MTTVREGQRETERHQALHIDHTVGVQVVSVKVIGEAMEGCELDVEVVVRPAHMKPKTSFMWMRGRR
jgi:hypothetical protein